MKTEDRSQRSEVRSQRFKISRKKFAFCFLLFSVFCLLSCSVPNLEKGECAEARDTVKSFYSFHFDNDMKFSPENLKKREKFLTPEYFKSLQNLQTDKDVFTDLAEFPRAFRVGGCRVIEPNKRVNFGVLMFWRDDTRTEQREVNVEAVKQNNNWLIDKISGKN